MGERQEGQIQDDYERRLAELFESNRDKYVSIATQAILAASQTESRFYAGQAAQELDQDAFLAFHKNKSLDFNLNPKQIDHYIWMYISSLVKNFLAKQARIIEPREHQFEPEVSETTGSRESTADFEKAVSELPNLGNKDKQVLIELYVNGKTMTELADEWKVTRPAIRNRIKRIFNRLKSNERFMNFLKKHEQPKE